MSLLVEDRIWGIMTLWQEARSESHLGKVAVAEVILRRTKNNFLKCSTIAQTVLKPYQFSGWNTGDNNRILSAALDTEAPIVRDCIKAWEEAEGETNLVPNCMNYFNPKVCDPLWSVDAMVVADIGNHRFVIPKGG